MKKYYSITMILKNTSTEDDEFTLSGKDIVADENELDSLAKDLAESYDKQLVSLLKASPYQLQQK